MGGDGEYVTEPQKNRPALDSALTSGRPSLGHVMIDPNVYSSGKR
jgi:thiamine pyrophosphate-dependent acetolactate synthase large subunit-like protein